MKRLMLVFFAALILCGFSSCQKNKEDCSHRSLKETEVAPTCAEPGYILNTCSDCGYAFKSHYTEPSGHHFLTETVKPRCEAQGYTAYTCSVCEFTYLSDFTAPTGHDFTVTECAPTCTERGYTRYACKNCEYAYQSDFTSALGHRFLTVVHEETCTEAGYTEYICGICRYAYNSDYISATGHQFKKTQVPITFNHFGYTLQSCTVCDYCYLSDYAWYSDVFTGAAGSGEGVLAKGIDLSHHNEITTTIDFGKVKESGIDYVILRAGINTSGGEDRKFESYYKRAKEAGLDVGCYLYTYSTTVADLKKDVKLLIQWLDGKKFEYPIYLDMEEANQEALTTEIKMEMYATFCDMLLEKGYFPGIYTNLNWVSNYLNVEKLTTLFEVFFARYNSTLPEDYYDSSYGMWQYSDNGSVPGIDGKVDLDVCYKDYPSIIKKYGYNGY